MDENLNKLLELGERYKTGDIFSLDDPNFYLTQDGLKWLKQVNENPLLFSFSDHGILIVNGTRRKKEELNGER